MKAKIFRRKNFVRHSQTDFQLSVICICFKIFYLRHWHLLPENPGGQIQELFSWQEPPLRHIEQSSKDKIEMIAKNSKDFDNDNKINRNFQWLSTEWLFVHWNLKMLVFEERENPEYPEINFSEQRREPTTKSTHILRRVREFIPSHIGRKKASFLNLSRW